MSEPESTQAGREEIWLEKYRPQTLDDVLGQEAIVERLQSYVDQDDLSHLLFAGPAGVGKCLTGETPVLTSEGLQHVEDVVGDHDGFEPNTDGLEVLTYTEGGEFEYTQPSHLFGKAADDLVRVRTRDGNEMTVTPEHKLLVVDDGGFDWREASDLDRGDRVVRPLEAPLPAGDCDLDWLAEMDGERTLVHLSEAFSERHEIPFEEDLVGTKKAALRGLRKGRDEADIAANLDTTKGTVQAARREFEDADLDSTSTRCSLSYLRSLDVEREDLSRHVEAIQYVSTTNKRSRPVTPPWKLTPDLARFLGLAISEARIEGGRIKFYNTDEALLAEFERLVGSLFDLEPETGEQQGVPYVEVRSKTLTHYLECCFDVFDGPERADGIGSTILRGDEESRRAFLQAVFDAEGHVTDHGIVELTQKDETIITLVSYLLAGFGVPSRKKTTERRATNGSGPPREYYSLYLSSADHLETFEATVGFSIDRKAERLATATARKSNPNDDTVPTQDAVGRLCDRLNLTKRTYVPESLDPESPGRQRYVSGLSTLVDDAAARLEAVQEARERLVKLEPTVDDLTALPARWVGERSRLEPVETRRSLAAHTSAGQSRLLEYARGDRDPYVGRIQTLLAGLGEETDAEIATVQGELQQIIDQTGVSYSEIATETEMYGPGVGNLLDNDDLELASLSRFQTVVERLDEIFTEMASRETLADLRALHRLVESDIYLDEVEAVEAVSQPQRVYDLTVPETHNYVAGAVPMVVHNTTSAVAIARELYGDDWQEHFLELNASDERGIDVVRDRIKSFARTSFGGAKYRIIFLDEADALTSDAQGALRRTMEQFSNNVRFILSCNYSSQIIDPIQSRCTVFRFSPLSDEAIAAQVRKIADSEGIEITDDGVDALVYVAGGDMRAAINGLQAAAVTDGPVDEEAVFEITSTARPEDIEQMVTLALDGDFTASRTQLDRLLTEEGIAGGDVIDQLHRSVWEFGLDDEAAVRVLDRIGEADYRITEGANERIQLEALLASLALEE